MSQEAKDNGQRKDVPRGHIFDGIQEYDNDMPRWWVIMFVVTVIFAAGYMAWYHGGIFPSQSLAQEYAADLATAKQASLAQESAEKTFDYTAIAKDPAVVSAGRETFQTTCAPCHGPQGQGVVGPNLTDDFWINGATFASVDRVISHGVLEKGMPAWGEILGHEKVTQLVAFIGSIQGSSPPTPKPAQGTSGKLQ